MKELVVISGKGGTGKTSVVASLAALAGEVIIADCDVDAADLHLVLAPTIRGRHEFRSGHTAIIRQADCTGCGLCVLECRFEAVRAVQGDGEMPKFRVDPWSCEGCGVCVRFCPERAIDFPERVCGEWFVSQTRFGPLVHARLAVAAENSGKLVSLVRKEARALAEKHGARWLLVDGPPGIGCPVIASITGASLVLAVTEPSLSGEHDLERVLRLAGHFNIPALVCVNKWEINPALADRIEHRAVSMGAAITRRIGYDPAVTTAQVRGTTVIEHGGRAAGDIREVWKEIEKHAGSSSFSC